MSAKIIGNPDIVYVQGKGYIVIVVIETWKLERLEFVFNKFIEASKCASKYATLREIEL